MKNFMICISHYSLLLGWPNEGSWFGPYSTHDRCDKSMQNFNLHFCKYNIEVDLKECVCFWTGISWLVVLISGFINGMEFLGKLSDQQYLENIPASSLFDFIISLKFLYQTSHSGVHEWKRCPYANICPTTSDKHNLMWTLHRVYWLAIEACAENPPGNLFREQKGWLG